MHLISNYVSFKKLSPTFKAFVANLSSCEPIPSTIYKAPFAPRWKHAIFEEMGALKHTWELVDLHLGKRPMECKWVFTAKHNADGIVERYKAKLVAKGLTQTYGVDYQEKFDPIAKMNSV